MTECFEKLARGFAEVYVFVDGIDESDRYDERPEILKALAKIRAWEGCSIHLLATSRAQSGVEGKMYPLKDEQIGMENEGVSADIEWFIRNQLRSREGLEKWEAEFPEIQDTLTSTANGNFRWVDCQLRALEKCANNKRALRKTLESLPKTLQETYERMLPTESGSERKVLAFICFSERPLGIEEVLDATGIDLEPEPIVDPELRVRTSKDLLTQCDGLIDRSREARYTEKGWVNFDVLKVAHSSVLDCLESDQLSNHPEKKVFSMQKQVVHDELTQSCLTYLLDPRLLHDCQNGNSQHSSPLADHKLANYAAMYWYRHYKKAKPASKKTHQMVRKLLVENKEAFLNWIRVWDPDRVLMNLRYVFSTFDRSPTQIPTPVYYASLLGLPAFVSELLSGDAGYGSLAGFDSMSDVVNSEAGLYGYPLQAASFYGHKEIIQLLLGEGANVNATGGRYGTALQAAALEGREDVVRLLLRNGSDANIVDGVFGTALQAACFRGLENIARLLLDKQALVDAGGGEYFGTSLQAASYGGYENLVQLLLDYGADINKRTGGFYDTPLVAASVKGQPEIVELLLKKVANVNTGAGYFGSPLQAASYKGHATTVKLLLNKTSGPEQSGGEYGTALQAACAEGHLEVARLLLEMKKDVNARGGKYGNALQAACFQGHLRLVKLLLANGVDIFATGCFGTPLEAASRSSNETVKQMLLDEHARMQEKSPRERSISIVVHRPD